MFQKILYAMLAFAVAGFVADLVGASPILVFILSAIGLIPLADLIGKATEELVVYTGPRVGGLLNATLGNAAELIITIFALREGLLELVRASIVGSILGNLLLILGLSLLLGGIKHGIQTFDRRQAGINATLALLAVIALAVPSFFSPAIEPDIIAETRFNEGVAIVMIALYGLSIFYSMSQRDGPAYAETGHHADHETHWSLPRSLLVLGLATAGTALMSEVLVGAVEQATETLGLTELFLGIIIIPLVGNVAEHLVAVQVASKNQMELSLGIALGSSLQIALFVAPLLVFISLLFDDTLLLIFNSFELAALFGAALVAALIALDGESNWLEGAMLLSIYLLFALAFFFLPGI